MRPTPWSPGALAGVVVALVAAVPAPAQAATLDQVTIVGDPVVGSPLNAEIGGTVDPSAVTYRWCHQRAGRPDKCAPGPALGTSATYVPVPGDVGHPLLVRASANVDGFAGEVVSAPTAPVAATPPDTTEPVPPSTTPPAQAPDSPQPGGNQAPAGNPAPGPVSAPVLRYLQPFPVVRVRGFVARRGARITMLRVTAPRRAKVGIRCAGRGCPFERRTRRAGRIRALERFLPARLRITLRVTSPGRVGKYVRLLIRAGKPPARRDACVLPGDRRPAPCPPR